MKIVLFIFFLSLAPTIGQELFNKQNDLKTDSLFSQKSGGQTYIDSLRNAVPKQKSHVDGYLYQVIFVTFFLILFLVAGLYLYKKFILKNDAPFNSIIKILARQSLSAKQSILIVSIEGEKYALGVTEHQVNLIADLGKVNENDLKINSVQPVGFGQILKKLTTRE